MGRPAKSQISHEMYEMISWVAGLGAASAEALARAHGTGAPSARARLSLAERRGLLVVWRPLRDQPALYTVTRAGLHGVGLAGVEPARVSPGGARHAVLCSLVAAELANRYHGREVIGEAELRRRERESRTALASVPAAGRGQAAHRPDLVVLSAGERAPLAVEVELTVKSPQRLAVICRSWARARHVGGVLYLATEQVRPPLARAIELAGAQQRIAVLPLETFEAGERPSGAIERAITGAA